MNVGALKCQCSDRQRLEFQVDRIVEIPKEKKEKKKRLAPKLRKSTHVRNHNTNAPEKKKKKKKRERETKISCARHTAEIRREPLVKERSLNLYIGLACQLSVFFFFFFFPSSFKSRCSNGMEGGRCQTAQVR